MALKRIISSSGEQFLDRAQAARLLADQLSEYKGKTGVVLGIPRGGIVIADVISSLLGFELDVLLVRKLGAPGNPEFAIGAMSEDGRVYLNKGITASARIDDNYFVQEESRQYQEIKQRKGLYRKIKPKIALKDKIVIITDDGLATGMTMQAAIWASRKEKPRRIVVSLPVAARESLENIKGADEIIVLRCPDFFTAVGQFYKNFGQVKDEEVLAMLKKSL